MARRRRKQADPVEALMAVILLAGFFLTFQATKSIAASLVVGAVILVVFFFVAYFIKLRGEERLRRSGIADIDKMDGRQFEIYLVVLFKNLGYAVNVTRAAGDFGADLVIEKAGKRIVVQAKRYSKNVGIEAVQQVVGSIKQYGASEGWVISNRDYTEAAYTLAKSNAVRLINRQELIELALKLNSGPAPATLPKQVMKQAPHEDVTCERCGSPMVRRKSTKGEFYGCSTFPKCRGMKEIKGSALH